MSSLFRESQMSIPDKKTTINGKKNFLVPKIYIAIDLKSFYASVECVDRHLDALTTNLVVADESRTEKTICLAVTPSLKAYGISGRARNGSMRHSAGNCFRETETASITLAPPLLMQRRLPQIRRWNCHTS